MASVSRFPFQVLTISLRIDYVHGKHRWVSNKGISFESRPFTQGYLYILFMELYM